MRRPSLTLPFALVGVFGGVLYGFCLGRPTYAYARYPWELIAALGICTGLTCAVFGSLMSRRTSEVSVESQVSATIFWAFLAGVVNGTLILACVALYEGPGRHFFDRAPAFLIGAWIVGAISSVPFMVPLGWIVAANERARARTGSVLREVQTRNVYRAALAPLAVGTLLAPRRGGAGKPFLLLHPPALFTLVVFATLVYFVLRDREANARIVDVTRERDWTRDDPDAPKPRVAREASIDYGIGDASFRRTGTAPNAYRSIAPTTEVVVGDAVLCRSMAASAYKGSIACAIVAAATVAYHVLLT